MNLMIRILGVSMLLIYPANSFAEFWIINIINLNIVFTLGKEDVCLSKSIWVAVNISGNWILFSRRVLHPTRSPPNLFMSFNILRPVSQIFEEHRAQFYLRWTLCLENLATYRCEGPLRWFFLIHINETAYSSLQIIRYSRSQKGMVD